MISDYSAWFVVKLVTNVSWPIWIFKRRLLVKTDNGSEVRHFRNKIDVIREYLWIQVFLVGYNLEDDKELDSKTQVHVAFEN